MIDLYSCQPGGIVPCQNILKTYDIMVSSFLYEKTVNIKEYDHPISSKHREINMIIPAKGLRYQRVVHVGWTDIWTDKGFWNSSWKKELMITMMGDVTQTGQKDLANIPRNYLSQGRIFYSDLDIHLEIMTTNDKVEIYRRYLSIIDVFSAVGG
jgi:hypothetical protein